MAHKRILLPRLASDPDARLVRWGWIGWGGLTLLLAVQWILSPIGALGSVWLVQAVALWLLWPLYRGGGALWRWMRAAPHAAWNGAYYEFDGRQMRMLFDDDEIYVIADDVFAALDLRGHATDPARVRLIAGSDGLRQLPGRRELAFTERGLNAWLHRRSGDDAIRLRRWLEREAIAPYRRRRERQTGSVGRDP